MNNITTLSSPAPGRCGAHPKYSENLFEKWLYDIVVLVNEVFTLQGEPRCEHWKRIQDPNRDSGRSGFDGLPE